jgi:hypothetical protein
MNSVLLRHAGEEGKDSINQVCLIRELNHRIISQNCFNNIKGNLIKLR